MTSEDRDDLDDPHHTSFERCRPYVMSACLSQDALAKANPCGRCGAYITARGIAYLNETAHLQGAFFKLSPTEARQHVSVLTWYCLRPI